MQDDTLEDITLSQKLEQFQKDVEDRYRWVEVHSDADSIFSLLSQVTKILIDLSSEITLLNSRILNLENKVSLGYNQ